MFFYFNKEYYDPNANMQPQPQPQRPDEEQNYYPAQTDAPAPPTTSKYQQNFVLIHPNLIQKNFNSLKLVHVSYIPTSATSVIHTQHAKFSMKLVVNAADV